MSKIGDKYFGAVRKLMPSKAAGSSVGLDIGAGDCKLVEIEKKGDSYELINCAIESVENGDIKKTLTSLLGKLKNPCKALYTSLSGKGTLIRFIELPRMNLEDLRNSFDIESDKYFPFTKDQIYTDCYILDAQGKDKKMAVMAAASKRDLVKERIELLNKLSLPSDFVGINAVALANAVHVLGTGQDKKDKDAFALLDLGESVSNVTIFKDNVPLFTRDILQGGRDLTKRISNAFSVSFEEAEKLKRDPGDKKASVLTVCETAILGIVNDLRLSFDYFTTEKNSEVKRMLLTGGASMLDGISDLFEKNLEISVAPWNALDFVKVADSVDKEITGVKGLKLGVAVGLALYNYD